MTLTILFTTLGECVSEIVRDKSKRLLYLTKHQHFLSSPGRQTGCSDFCIPLGSSLLLSPPPPRPLLSSVSLSRCVLDCVLALCSVALLLALSSPHMAPRLTRDSVCRRGWSSLTHPERKTQARPENSRTHHQGEIVSGRHPI